MPTYPIIEVPAEAREHLESVGSKEKFWYTREEDEQQWLFKANRLIRPADPESWAGEDWSEKVAAELSTLLGLPHADYELASWTDKRGVVSRRIEYPGERLVLGNELLAGHVQGYPLYREDKFYRIRQYTLSLTLDTLDDAEIGIVLDPEWMLPEGTRTACEAFVGFLLLDAWIGNTDRHDKNWGVLERSTEDGVRRYLSPTFDHASSMGRELTEEERHERLTTRDRGRQVEAYVRKAKSGFFLREGDKKTMHPVAAFETAADRFPDAAQVWLDVLASVDEADVTRILEQVPEERISAVGTDFALKVLHLNRQALLGTHRGT